MNSFSNCNVEKYECMFIGNSSYALTLEKGTTLYIACI